MLLDLVIYSDGIDLIWIGLIWIVTLSFDSDQSYSNVGWC